jgi:glycosyltransferase involved in cell wall biosynthesis
MPRTLDLALFNWMDRRNPRAGGAEVHLHEVFGRLARRGHRITLVACGWPGAFSRERVDGIDVHRVGTRESYALLAPRYFRTTLAGARFDVLVEDYNKLPLFAPRWAGVPTVLIAHHLFGRAAFAAASPPVAALSVLLERRLAGAYGGCPVIAVSESTASSLVRLGSDPGVISVVYNGIEDALRRRGPAPARFPEPTLLYVGRLESYKRVDLLIHAVAHLRTDHGDARGRAPVRLIVAGDGRRGPALRRLAARLGVAGHVEFRGRVGEGEKRALMERSWVHVIASEREGWGLTVMEAAARGTPTIASNVPGLRDSVVHEVTGLLVPPRDARALADAIRALLDDDATREALGSAARERAERFSWDRAADGVEAVLAAAAAGRASADAGAWFDFTPRAADAMLALPCTGESPTAFGCSTYRVAMRPRVDSHEGTPLLVSIGASDRMGRHVFVSVRSVDCTGAGASRVPWTAPLPGWPVDHDRFLARLLGGCVEHAERVDAADGAA